MLGLLCDDQKQRLVDLFEQGFGSEAAARIVGCTVGSTGNLYQYWRLHGSMVFMPRQRREYSPEFKQEAVERYLAGQTAISLAADMGISSPRLVVRWARIWRREGPEGLMPKKRGRPTRPVPDEASLVQALQQRLKEADERLLYLEAENAFKSIEGSEHPLSRARAIEMLRSHYPLEVLLHVSGLAKSTFYYQRNCLYHRVDKYAHIREQIHDLWIKNDGKIGVVRMHGALRQKQVISRKVIRRLMREEGLEPTVRVKKNTRRNQTGFVSQVAPNILNRRFHPDKANTVWVSDVSIFIIAGKRLYLSPVIDLCGGQVLSYTLSTRHSPAFVTESLKGAFDAYTPAPGLIVHTDQGINYHHESWRKLIHDHGAIQSIELHSAFWTGDLRGLLYEFEWQCFC